MVGHARSTRATRRAGVGSAERGRRSAPCRVAALVPERVEATYAPRGGGRWGVLRGGKGEMMILLIYMFVGVFLMRV